MEDETLFRLSFARELRRARARRGLTRPGLAARAAVHPNTLAAAERGERDLGCLAQTKILAALGCPAIRIAEGGIELDLDGGPFDKEAVLRLPDPRVAAFMGGAVRARREAAGLSIPALARAAGVHKNTVWYLEKGLVCPTGSTIFRILKALGVSRARALPTGMELD